MKNRVIELNILLLALVLLSTSCVFAPSVHIDLGERDEDSLPTTTTPAKTTPVTTSPTPTPTPTPTPINARGLYTASCAACHGLNRQGGAGPALTTTTLTGRTTAQIVDKLASHYADQMTAPEKTALAEYLLSPPAPTATTPVPSPSPTAAATPSSVIGLTITSPVDGATVEGGNVTVNIAVTNFSVADKPGQSNADAEGHVHYFLDVEAPTAPGQPAMVALGEWRYNATTTCTFTQVVDGPHTLSVELVNNDHTPLVPPVVSKISFTVINGYVRSPDTGSDGGGGGGGGGTGGGGGGGTDGGTGAS